MFALAQHIMVRLADNRVIAPTVALCRTLARTVLKISRGSRLLAFRSADNHLHAATLLDRHQAGELARRIEIGLHYNLHLPVKFEKVRIKPVENQGHLSRLFEYILDQDKHHGTERDPFHEASSLPDLLGLRVLGSDVLANVRAYLPRVNRAQLLELLGDDLEHPIQRWEPLATSAAAAVGLPRLSRCRTSTRARRAAVHVAGKALTAMRLANQLGCTKRTITRMRSLVVDSRIVKAVELQLRLRQQPRHEGRLP